MEAKDTKDENSSQLAFMREALAMASRALSSDETPVGCVFVHNNTVIGRGMNATNRTYNGTRHAEFVAIDDILSRRDENGRPTYSPEILAECDLYVTVEPCIMCASLLRQIGVRKVYFGAKNDKFGGTGGVLNIQRRNGMKALNSKDGDELGIDPAQREREQDDYEVSGGWLREEAIVMLRRFYVQENERAPEPRSKKERVLKLEVEPMIEGEAGES